MSVGVAGLGIRRELELGRLFATEWRWRCRLRRDRERNARDETGHGGG